jgi:hypothetical protein
MQYNGLVAYLTYFLAFWNTVINYLFDSTTGIAAADLIHFSRDTVNPSISTSGQWVLNGNTLPNLTTKGSDMLAAIMTIAHNGLVALAQLSTLLPANAL